MGTTSKAEARGGRGLFADASWAELDEAEQNEVAFARMRPVSEVLDEHPWLAVCAQIAEQEGFFHWELDFAPVFATRGGFDLQLGNPPWVRPLWDDALVLAEDDAWFGLADRPTVQTVRDRRTDVLHDGDQRYLDERASLAGISAHLGSTVDRPLLSGTQPDLYRCFMERIWRSMGPCGAVGLIHPESHFTEARAGGLRRQTYRRLRRHWQFSNMTHLFPEISHKTDFGVSVYGQPREPSFLNASSLFHPSVADRSLDHDGTGPEPGIRDEDDRWDTRPHASRIVRVDETVLKNWAALIDESGTPQAEARMLRPVNTASQRVLNKLALSPRFGAVSFEWTAGWHESADRSAGFFVGRSAVPESLDDVILQGPHLSVANPFARQPNVNARNRQDTTAWDLETLPERPIPRTNYQPAKPAADYVAGYPRWNDIPANKFWRLAWRNMVDSSTVRSLHAALLPPGPMHVHVVHSLTTPDARNLAIGAGLWASLPADFLVKVNGASKVQAEFAARHLVTARCGGGALSPPARPRTRPRTHPAGAPAQLPHRRLCPAVGRAVRPGVAARLVDPRYSVTADRRGRSRVDHGHPAAPRCRTPPGSR